MPELEIPELRTDFVFRRQPVAVPGDLRPIWRIGLVVQLLKKCCRHARSSLARIHVLSWGIRTKDSRLELQSLLQGSARPDSLIVRFEPYLNRAIDFAIGEGLVHRDGGKRIELTATGLQYANELDQLDGVYFVEKQFMDAIGQRITETLVSKIFT